MPAISQIKIGCIFDNFYPKLGGGPVQNRTLVENLVRSENFSPLVFPLMWEEGLDKTQFSCSVFPIRIYKKFPSNFNKVTPSIVADRLYNLLISRKIREQLAQVDIIHTDIHSAALIGAYYKKRLGKKLVIRFGGNVFRQQERRHEIEDKYHWFKRLFFQIPARYSFKAADAIIVNGEDLKYELIQNGIDRQKIHIIPVGLETHIFHPPLPVDEILPAKPGKTLRLLFYGRITEANGPLQFLQLIRQFKDNSDQKVQASVIGDGPHLSLMKKLAMDQNLPISFYPPLKHPELAEQIRKHHFCIFPFRKIGGVSSVVVESMACGRIVFASETGDLSSFLIHGQNAFLTVIDNVNSCFNNILKILKDPERQIRISLNASNKVKRQFSWKHSFEKYKTIYQRIIKE